MPAEANHASHAVLCSPITWISRLIRPASKLGGAAGPGTAADLRPAPYRRAVSYCRPGAALGGPGEPV
jgi:hypothetical protein